MTLVPLSQLLLHARDNPQPVAVREGEPIRLSQFYSDVAANAHRLQGCANAVLACEDSYHFMVGMFALLHMQASIVLPANTHGSVMDHFRATHTLVDDAFVTRPAQGELMLAALDTDLPLLQFYTSGTTAAPKIIRKNLAQLEEEVARIHAALSDNISGGIVLATVPHQHLYCLVFKLLWPLCSGRTFSTHTHAQSFWEMILPGLAAGSTIVSSPAHLSRLGGIAAIAAHQQPVKVLSAGALLPFVCSEQSAGVFGSPPIEVFGSTETGAIATRVQQSVEDPWKLLPGVTLERDAEEQMIVSTCMMAPLTTADRIALCPDGFRFLGRTDRIVKIEAKRVSLPEVEAALLQLEEVTAGLCLVVQDTMPRLACVAVLSPAAKVLLAKQGSFRFSRCLRAALRPALEPTAIPRIWRFVDALPTHGIGKTDLQAVLALFEGRP